MNAIDRILGKTNESVVPVVATVPTFRKQEQEAAQRRRSGKHTCSGDCLCGKCRRSEKKAPVEGVDESVGLIRSILGENYRVKDEDEMSDSDGVIPKDAEDLDDNTVGRRGSFTAQLKDVEPDDEEASEPQTADADREGLISPLSALTAPDATPNAYKPLSPAQIPGAEAVARFTSQDALKARETPPSAGVDRTLHTLDTLLGRRREPAMSGRTNEFPPDSANVMTAEAAEALFNPKSSADLLQEGMPMPEPTQSDGKQVLSAFRKFGGPVSL